MEKIRNSNVKSVLQLAPGAKQIAWFCAVDFIRKTTRNKKIFYRIKIVDNESNSGWLRVWGELPDGMEKFTIWLAEVSADRNWGPSTSSRKIRPLVV